MNSLILALLIVGNTNAAGARRPCPTCPVCPIVATPTPAPATTPVVTPVPVPTTAPTTAKYEVGAGKQYATLGAVPFETLKPGDVVRIHCGTYKEKILLKTQGPIRIEGVRCPDGTRPVIDGENATTRSSLGYRVAGQAQRGLLNISWGAGDDWGHKPKNIHISGLHFTNAHASKTFKHSDGQVLPYTKHAAAIFIERGENITVSDVEISHSGNGFFVASGDSEEVVSRNIRLEKSLIQNNGNVGSDREHNIYTEAVGMVFEGNDIRPLLAGAGGSAFKDRSAGLVFRNNRVEGGARTLDLVEAQESYQMVKGLPAYRTTLVEGNTLIAGVPGPVTVVHYGGDSGMLDTYRKGTLIFRNNIVNITADQAQRWRSIVFQAETNDESIDATGNSVTINPSTVGAPVTSVSWMHTAGKLNLGAGNTVNRLIGHFRDGVISTGTVTGAATVRP